MQFIVVTLSLFEIYFAWGLRYRLDFSTPIEIIPYFLLDMCYNKNYTISTKLWNNYAYYYIIVLCSILTCLNFKTNKINTNNEQWTRTKSDKVSEILNNLQSFFLDIFLQSIWISWLMAIDIPTNLYITRYVQCFLSLIIKKFSLIHSI